jgi:transposase
MDEHAPAPLNIPADDWAVTPASVRAVVLALFPLVEQVAVLEAKLRDLEAKLNQTSQHASKPPSSDPPSSPPRPAKTPRGRQRGGPPGHEGHQRPLVPPEQVDRVVSLHPEACPVCQSALDAALPDGAPIARTQVWELPVMTPCITEYQHHTVCCPTCQTRVVADRPQDAPPGAFGPRATALIALLHGRYRLSDRETAAVLADVFGLPLSLGSIATSCARVSTARAPIDAAIQPAVQAQDVANVDETGWKEAGQRCWLWAATTPVATCFRIAKSRGRPSLWALLGAAFGGIVGSDRMKAYNGLPDGQRQLCWAHLTRNLRALAEYGHPDSPWAVPALVEVDARFVAWHAFCAGHIDRAGVQAALIPVQTAVRDLLMRGQTTAWYRIQGLSGELLTHWDALWTFSTVPGVEPTNNAAERVLRPAVLWRKGCFGTQSASGSRCVERMLSVTTTCRQQGRQLFAFLTDAVAAAWAGQLAPALV